MSGTSTHRGGDTDSGAASATRMATDLEGLIGGWERTFVNRALPYALQQDDGTYRWVFRSCDARALRAHLAGRETLALSSLDAGGRCRWLCLDADAPDGTAQLRRIAAALAALELPGLLEASRRGGHLWLFFAAALPAALPRAVVGAMLDGLVARGELAHLPEVYPDTDGADPARLGHAVRLPLGVHRRTGRRYPLLAADGEPLPLATPRDLAAQMAHLLAYPRISAARLRVAAGRLGIPPEADEAGEASEQRRIGRAGQGGRGGRGGRRGDHHARGALAPAPPHGVSDPPGRVAIAPFPAGPIPIAGTSTSTSSAVIRWVDARVSPLDLLDDLCPQSEMRVAGQGFLGWCPFHDDRAPDERGEPGTPSFYVVHNARYGWSWRCLSSNCPYSEGPMKHTFRLLQELLGLDVRAAIGAALARWANELANLEHTGGVDVDGEDSGSNE